MKIPKNKLLQALKDYYTTYNKIPPVTDFPNRTTYKRRFGSWNEALKAANLPTRKIPTPKVSVLCLNCNKKFLKPHNQIIESPNHFCCKSCAATYNNKHKVHGYRRSKLEIHLENQIEQHYPELKCKYNDKTIIDSELDFYFPTLKFAIELNGIFHYEPIYGKDKLEKVQNNDSQKILQCANEGIELCIIDSSTCKYLNEIQKNKYWNIVNSIIESIYQRHNINFKLVDSGRYDLPTPSL